MSPPRFLFILSVHANLVRAALVTRELRIASSAHKTFQIPAGAFDPAEVWFQVKRVTAACFDIGRTLPRELIAAALVSDDDAWVVWQENAGAVQSLGLMRNDARVSAARFDLNAPICGGTLRAWILWNLSGAYVIPARELEMWRARADKCRIALSEPRACEKDAGECFGKIRARGPFAAELPVMAVLSEKDLGALGRIEVVRDDAILRAAARVLSP